MNDPLNSEAFLDREIARLSQALASVDSGDFFGAYTEAEVAAMRTRLQRFRRTLADLNAHANS